MLAPESLGQVLVEIGLITEPQLAELELQRRRTNRRLTEELVAAAIVTEDRLVSELARYLEMEVVDPARTPIHERVLSVVPSEVAHKYRVLPMARTKEGDVECLFVVTTDPFDDMAAGVLRDLLPDGTAVRYLLAGESQLSDALKEHYGAVPRDDTVSAPAPNVARGDTGGVRLGGSAAMALTQSMIPDDAEETRVDDTTPKARTAPPPAPVKVSPKPKPPSKRLTTKKPEPKDDSQVANYSLKTRVGVSGVAETWVATVVDGPVPNQRVNLRRMLPSLPKNDKTRANFFGSAKEMVGVQSPHLVEVLEADTAGDQDYVVTENVEGIELHRALAAASTKRKVIPVPFALRIIRGVLDALRSAHEAMVFHEHLSPRTVLVAKDGIVKVHDFGVKPTLMEERGRYVAPEQANGEADARTDVFRAGAILYELLAGEPLVAASVKEHSAAVGAIHGYRKTLAERRDGLDPAIDKLLAKMLAVTPSNRYATAEACLDDVEGLVERLGSAASDAGLWRYVEDLLHAPAETENPSSISAAVASERVKEMASRAQDRAAPLLEDAGDRAAATFERLMSAPVGVKVAIGVGAFLCVVVASAVVAAVVSTGERDTSPVTVSGEEAPPPEDEPPLIPPKKPRRKSQPASDPKRIEVFSGVYDGPAPEGSAYVKTHGVELRALAGEDDPEVLLWLEVGQTVREIADVDGEKLVLIPPRGPAGFVHPGELTKDLPLAALARAVAFDQCRVDRKRSLDDCLYEAKQKHDKCLDRCQGREGTRCKPACNLAFETCLGACRESQQVADERPRRRRRRRR